MGAWTEIIAVDDGSRDGTRAVVERVMKTDRRVRLVAFDANQGKASAVMAGFDAAKGDALFIVDADMAVIPEELPKFLAAPGRPRRFHQWHPPCVSDGGQGDEDYQLPREQGLLLPDQRSVTSTGQRHAVWHQAFFKQDYLRMPIEGTERWGDFDLLFGAARLRLRILEIPVHYQERRAGLSKMRVVKDGFLFLNSCLNGWKKLRLYHADSWTTKRQGPTPSVVRDGRRLELAEEGTPRQPVASNPTSHNGAQPGLRD
jgi:glycosyltransferase involved in cell wall biosynthesis